MKQTLMLIICFTFSKIVVAQNNTKLPQQMGTATEQQLENITENNADEETEDDSYLLELSQYQKDPVNINEDVTPLTALHLISPLQLENLIAYRRYLGNLISIYELQSLPGWDIATIQKIRPYITVRTAENLATSLRTRLKNGDHTILIRSSQTLERSQGYIIDPNAGKNFYQGSPQKILFRYRYNYKNILQYGLLGEKDAGEQFFKGTEQHGFDFYSAHFFAKKIGMIRSLAVGDYTVNMGQGLIQWMSLAFKKGPDILSVKREADILRPYSAAGEINFYRGVAITLRKKRWEATVFGSVRKIDANFSAADSVGPYEDFVTSFQTSGYHRTPSETADKSIQRQQSFGGNISYRFNNLKIGLNAVKHQFRYPLIRSHEPYNLYALMGKNLGNYSLDYSFTKSNFHVFGELAMSDKNAPAFLSGILISTSFKTDLSILYRNISKRYQSLYSNAFTENSRPSNENGLFAGITIRPSEAWRIDGYVDFYTFPWLKYRVNMPSSGQDYTIQLTYKPNKTLEIYTRYHTASKSLNDDPDGQVLSAVMPQSKKNWRINLSYKLDQTFTVRCRSEILSFEDHSFTPENGFLLYTDLLYNPSLSPFAASGRIQYFETDNYNSRIYAYENDVLYSYSIPVFYGKAIAITSISTIT